MNDAGFPGRHTTTTQVTETQVQTDMRFDPKYLKSIPGIIKCTLIVLNLLGFICIQVSGPVSLHPRGTYFSTVSMIGFWFTGILLLFYLFHICEKFHQIPWLQIEMYANLIIVILYVFAASFAAAFHHEAFSAAAFFGFCAMCLYGFEAFLRFRSYKAGEIAQGKRTVQQQQTTVTIS